MSAVLRPAIDRHGVCLDRHDCRRAFFACRPARAGVCRATLRGLPFGPRQWQLVQSRGTAVGRYCQSPRDHAGNAARIPARFAQLSRRDELPRRCAAHSRSRRIYRLATAAWLSSTDVTRPKARKSLPLRPCWPRRARSRWSVWPVGVPCMASGPRGSSASLARLSHGAAAEKDRRKTARPETSV